MSTAGRELAMSFLLACCLLACAPPASRPAAAKAAFVVTVPVPGLRQGPPALAAVRPGDGREFIASPVTGAAPASAPALLRLARASRSRRAHASARQRGRQWWDERPLFACVRVAREKGANSSGTVPCSAAPGGPADPRGRADVPQAHRPGVCAARQ